MTCFSIATSPPQACLSSSSSPSPSHSPPSTLSWRALAAVAALAVLVPVSAYQPVTYAATAILGTRLYIYGGLTNPASNSSFSNQLATLSLANSFDTDTLPWELLPGNLKTAMAPGAPSKDQRRFIVGGSLNNPGRAPATIFDSTFISWIPAPILPSGSVAMTTYKRDAPGMALDASNGILVLFGGLGQGNITNELSLLDTNKASDAMVWTRSAPLVTLPALYAPILLYLPGFKLTLIMGGCDQLGSEGYPSHCAPFDTLYTLSSATIETAQPKVDIVQAGGDIPPPRFFGCATVMPDGNVFMLGGGNPKAALADAWILNVQDWTWSQRPIDDMPSEGIMGHSCEIAPNGQILVVGGHRDGAMVQNPISVIRTKSWSWADHYAVTNFSTGVKVGLSMSVIVVVGAILAGLLIRRRRNKRAAQAAADLKMKHASTRQRRAGSRSSSSHRRKNDPVHGMECGRTDATGSFGNSIGLDRVPGWVATAPPHGPYDRPSESESRQSVDCRSLPSRAQSIHSIASSVSTSDRHSFSGSAECSPSSTIVVPTAMTMVHQGHQDPQGQHGQQEQHDDHDGHRRQPPLSL